MLTLFSCIKRCPELTLAKYEVDYNSRKELLHDYAPDYFFKLENAKLTKEETKYLKFLFAYMPLSDYADYDFEFFLKNVQLSIEAKNTFSWGKDIPEDVFLHYVLPPRINNENMDSARTVFFKELRDRLIPMNMTMEQAALEINHWCHEKVTYRGTDERTISPLSAVRSAFGRCGEESTFTTAALRSAGIPARQVYTPRWAHTDDNHAWVEVFIDGEWRFIGACEPSPLTNMGWFAVPATRAMLVHTKQFGNEQTLKNDVLFETANFSWVNTLDTYAPTKKLVVIVLDENKLPVWNAEVQFQIYNYAELYPIHTTKTDITGCAKFKTGFGSMEVFVSDGKNFASVNIPADQTGRITIILSDKNVLPAEYSEYFPPVAGEILAISPELETENAKRLKYEDSVRGVYESSFYNQENAELFAKTFTYGVEICDYLIKSRGNWLELENFLILSSHKNQQEWATRMLANISEKDLRDTRADILLEHLDYALQFYSKDIPLEIFNQYVLSPRIANEMLKPYRMAILADLDSTKLAELRANPEKIADYVLKIVKTELRSAGTKISCNDLNTYRVPISPLGVHKLKLSDDYSLKIYFVAFCRSIGIPARIEQATEIAQIFTSNSWNDINLSITESKPAVKRTNLKLLTSSDARELKYRIHFSIAKLEGTNYKTVDLGWEIPISDFAGGIDLPVGSYMLLTAIRKEDGSVNVKRQYFELIEGLPLSILVELPALTKSNAATEKIKHFEVYNFAGNIFQSKELSITSKYSVFCWIDPYKEPSKHIVKDLTQVIGELNKNGIKVYIFVNDKNFTIAEYGFTNALSYYYDKDFDFLTVNSTCSKTGSGIVYPQIKMTNSNDEVIFSTQGYTIGIGEMLLNEVL